MASGLRKICTVAIILALFVTVTHVWIGNMTTNIQITDNLHVSSPKLRINKYYLKDSLILAKNQYPFNISKIKPYCNVSYYKSYGRIYNCSDSLYHPNKLRIGIVTAQLWFGNVLWDKNNDIHMQSSTYRMVLLNHIGYTIKHKYIYFEIRNLVETNLNGQYLKSIHIIKGQKPFIITQIFNDFNDSIDYLLWIDTDVLFYCCSYSIESQLINRAYNIYGAKHKYDFIWDFGLNSGIMLFKNSFWSNLFLSKVKYILMNAEKFDFYEAPPGYSGDQKCVWSLISGYDPFTHNKKTFVKHLKWFVDLFRVDYIINVTNITFNQLILDEHNDNLMDLFSKKIIKDESINHIALLPSFYMNFASQWFYNPNFTQKIDSDPFMVHFAGPPRNKALLHIEPFIYLNCFVPLR